MLDTSLGPGSPAEPNKLLCVRRGLSCRCPACGEGKLFDRYLSVVPSCDRCGVALHHHRADDFPPYIVMFIVGHIVGYGIYASETHVADIPLWTHAAIWPTLAVVLCLALLQPVKGAVVGLQFALGMHGFAQAARLQTAREPAGHRENEIERPARRGAEI
jgi:uncharacterized protein (DUF983 family)